MLYNGLYSKCNRRKTSHLCWLQKEKTPRSLNKFNIDEATKRRSYVNKTGYVTVKIVKSIIDNVYHKSNGQFSVLVMDQRNEEHC